jgi:hypothetical protein
MASPWGTRGSVTINDGKGSSTTIHIDEAPGLSAKSLSFATWGAAFVLSDLLHKLSLPLERQPDAKDFDILELGAGTGLVGISAAAIWKRNVLLTDLPSILPGLTKNININRDLLRESGTSLSCGTLDWFSPLSIHIPATHHTIEPNNASKPYIILAADTLYDTEHAPLMANSISVWLAQGPDSKAILCYPLRFAYIDCIREFWELMEAKGLHCVQEGRMMGKEEWNEVPGTEFEWCVWEWNTDRNGLG